MMRTLVLTMIAALGLAACGVDGPPEPVPAKAKARTGLTVSGTASVGVVGSF